MRQRRLLTTAASGDTGSALVETVFAMVVLVVLALGAVQVGLTLYARNVVAASAHDAARVAVERGRSPAEAEALARANVARAAGSLVDGLTVVVDGVAVDDRVVVSVRVRGRLRAPGPVPVTIPVEARAHAIRDAEIR